MLVCSSPLASLAPLSCMDGLPSLQTARLASCNNVQEVRAARARASTGPSSPQPRRSRGRSHAARSARTHPASATLGRSLQAGAASLSRAPFAPRRFDQSSVTSKSQVKSSVQRGIRNSIVEQYPELEEEIEVLLPKKEPLFVVKW